MVLWPLGYDFIRNYAQSQVQGRPGSPVGAENGVRFVRSRCFSWRQSCKILGESAHLLSLDGCSMRFRIPIGLRLMLIYDTIL